MNSYFYDSSILWHLNYLFGKKAMLVLVYSLGETSLIIYFGPSWPDSCSAKSQIHLINRKENNHRTSVTNLLLSLSMNQSMMHRIRKKFDWNQPSTDCLRLARIWSHAKAAQIPSFSLIWSDPVPKLSSPHRAMRPASNRLPKNFQPVKKLDNCSTEKDGKRETSSFIEGAAEPQGQRGR